MTQLLATMNDADGLPRAWASGNVNDQKLIEDAAKHQLSLYLTGKAIENKVVPPGPFTLNVLVYSD